MEEKRTGKFRPRFAFFGALAFMLSGGHTAWSQADPADTVFTNAKVYTVNEKQPWAEAVAIKGNKIVFVGSAADAKAVTVARCAADQ